MDLTIYDVIKGPVITDKAYKLNQKQKKLVLKVHPQANKVLVRGALERLFNVKIDKVNIITRKGKKRLTKGRKVIKGPMMKKAIITLKEGYTLDIFDQGARGMVATPQEAKKSDKKKKETAEKSA